MRKSKKGFTLVEVLVVILISGLVLSMIAGAMIFVTNSSGDLIHQAEDIDMAKNIEKYLRNLTDDFQDLLPKSEDSIVYKGEGEVSFGLFKIDAKGNLIEFGENDTEKKIFSDTGLTHFEIMTEGGFIKCSMTFDSGKHFVFTLGIVPETTQEGE